MLPADFGLRLVVGRRSKRVSLIMALESHDMLHQFIDAERSHKMEQTP